MAYEVFISYSHRDKELRNELEKHLSNLKRQQIIASWYDGDISPGTEWEPQIMEHLRRAQIILLLVSADFMASDFCYSIEMTQAIARHDANQARVIPNINPPPIRRNIPFERNPLFTGREDILKRLRTALKEGKTAALTQPQAISGLGGIGKTQTAVEYAYRYQDDYEAILWVKAESIDSLISDFVSIATLLDLPQKQEQEQRLIVEAVKRWFQDNTGWLLIFDNADDLAMVQGFLPSGGKGHILLTTRAHATGRLAQRIEVAKMGPEEGALFLLHRTTLLDANAPFEDAAAADQQTARKIVQAMDGLPLALDQAGAYIEETSCGLQGYLQLYQAQGTRLLKERGGLVTDHPDPVATTWSLSF
jgi:hypothetical protein